MLSGIATAAPQAVTPIEHVIVIVGENRSFDNLFATYRPKHDQQIWNLLSRGIVREDGTPGPNYRLSAQKTADMSKGYSPMPPITGGYRRLAQPYASGAIGQQQGVPDFRFPAELANGPFQITDYVSYGAHTGDPIHRFFQMWQQVNGGASDLFVWTAENFGLYRGDNINAVKSVSTNQGAVAMGFYNMVQGDAPYFRELAERYAIADNYHQAILGGTAPNYVAMVAADVAVHVENDKKAVPPAEQILRLQMLKNGKQLVENGGYYDSGYVQFLDFFGDGTRVPMIAVSPYARKGAVDHTYYDHASIAKFIEHNWNLPVLSQRSRDNLPNPVTDNTNPYVPLNRPALGDLMPLFDFGK